MPDFLWNPDSRSYEGASARDVRTWVAAAVDASKERAAQAARDYAAGSINRAEFIIRLREEMVGAQTSAAVIAYGGREQMDASRWGAIGSLVREQNEYLRAFERELANGLEMSADALAARAALYPELATCTYENTVVDRESAAGVEKFLWVCEADGTSCDECVGAAGEHTLESLPQLGSLACVGNCRCSVEPMVEAA